MKPVIDHVAIALKDIPALKLIFAVLGFDDGGSEVVSDQGVNTHFISGAPSLTTIELLEAVDEKGVVASYLEKRGPGIHHVAVRVGNLEAEMQKLLKVGVRFVYEHPRIGAHGKKINFIHPKSAAGILIELSQ